MTPKHPTNIENYLDAILLRTISASDPGIRLLRKMKIKDLPVLSTVEGFTLSKVEVPKSDRPREKLIAKGAENLKDLEVWQ